MFQEIGLDSYFCQVARAQVLLHNTTRPSRLVGWVELANAFASSTQFIYLVRNLILL